MSHCLLTGDTCFLWENCKVRMAKIILMQYWWFPTWIQYCLIDTSISFSLLSLSPFMPYTMTFSVHNGQGTQYPCACLVYLWHYVVLSHDRLSLKLPVPERQGLTHASVTCGMKTTRRGSWRRQHNRSRRTWVSSPDFASIVIWKVSRSQQPGAFKLALLSSLDF